MFDKNTIAGFLCMLLLLIGYLWWQAPSPEEVAAAEARADSLAHVQAQVQAPAPEPREIPVASLSADSLIDTARVSAVSAEMSRKYGILGQSAAGQEQFVKVTSQKFIAVLSTKGGMFKSVILTDGSIDFWDSTAVSLWDDSLSKMVLKLDLQGTGSVSTDELYFSPSATEIDATTEVQQLTMRLNTADSTRYLNLVYEFKPDSYSVQCNVQLVDLQNELVKDEGSVELEWDAAAFQHEKSLSVERQRSSVFFREMDEDRDYLSENSEDETIVEGKLNWFAFKQNFFSALVISKDGFGPGAVLKSFPSEDSTHTMRYHAEVALALSRDGSSNTGLTFFFGPNEVKTLKALEADQITRIIDYGPGIIGWVNRAVIRPLFVFFSGVTFNYGLIILIITIIIKSILFPVTWKNFLSSAKMRVIKPEMDEINKKYAEKPLEKQQAIMQLYRQTGVNPLAGCLPTLIQLPILYAMFRFFPASIEFRQKTFLWADDLAGYDAILTWDKYIPYLSDYYGNHISGFTILMCISTFFYTRLSMAATPAPTQPGMPNMKVMMNIFTVMMLFFFNNFASGLTLYYFTANVVSIGQMWFIKKYIINETAIREKIDRNKQKPVKKGGFAQRLEDLQKNQQKKLQAQKTKKN